MSTCFVVYKLKVAEAEAAGLHLTDDFRKEFDSYCAELSKPYLSDSLVRKRLIDEAYGRNGNLSKSKPYHVAHRRYL